MLDAFLQMSPELRSVLAMLAGLLVGCLFNSLMSKIPRPWGYK